MQQGVGKDARKPPADVLFQDSPSLRSFLNATQRILDRKNESIAQASLLLSIEKGLRAEARLVLLDGTPVSFLKLLRACRRAMSAGIV
jgi:hypothetical protein